MGKQINQDWRNHNKHHCHVFTKNKRFLKNGHIKKYCRPKKEPYIPAKKMKHFYGHNKNHKKHWDKMQSVKPMASSRKTRSGKKY